jgi:hypothetical protein
MRAPDVIFDILVTGPRNFRWEAEADSAEGAYTAASTGYDEAIDYAATWGCHRKVTVTILANGAHVATYHGRRPQ